MELKDLTDLGLTEEQAKQALDLHTAELTAEQQKVTDLSAQLEAAQKNITDLTEQVKKFDGEDIEGLKQAAKDWEKKYNADLTAAKLDKALEVALIGAKTRDVGITKGLIDNSALAFGEDGRLTGLDDQLDKLKAEKGFLFDSDEPTGARIDTGLDHGTAADTTADDRARAVMGLPATDNGGKK